LESGQAYFAQATKAKDARTTLARASCPLPSCSLAHTNSCGFRLS